MLNFQANQAAFEAEMEAAYANERDYKDLWAEFFAASAAHEEWDGYDKQLYAFPRIAEETEVFVLRHSPLYAHINNGKARTGIGMSTSLGSWIREDRRGMELFRQGSEATERYKAAGLCHCWPVTDISHHVAGVDHVFAYGLLGLREQATARRRDPSLTEKQRKFLLAMEAGLNALMRIGQRTAEKASAMAREEKDDEIRASLERIAESAGYAPAHPPRSFYEALNSMILLYYGIGAVDGNGMSGFGHVDRLLEKYYEQDLANGTLTKEEAESLLSYFMDIPDTLFGKAQTAYDRQNGTIVLGGCDRQGKTVFNDITRMLIRISMRYKLVDPKINIRVSSKHPPEFFNLLSELVLSGSNNTNLMNDDVLITANVRQGKALADARMYVGVGCQENVLAGYEVSSRASVYLNMPKIFLAGLLEEPRAELSAAAGCMLEAARQDADDEEIYAVFKRNLAAVYQALVDQRNSTEQYSDEYAPSPVLSATVHDCIDKATDLMMGGARYSSASIAFDGIADMIDSLLALRQTVTEEKRFTLDQMKEMLRNNFAGHEKERQYLLNRTPKYGQDDERAHAMAKRVFAELAEIGRDCRNSRGGPYEPSLFSFTSNMSLGQQTGALPSGRKAGESLSSGMGPSHSARGRHCDLIDALEAIRPLDMTDYPVVAVENVKFPAGSHHKEDAAPLIRRFVEVGGSVLQINCVDQEMLEAARKTPDQYRDLVVRVSGYSAFFVTLPQYIQDDIINRVKYEL